jgi:chorismate synthase
MLTRVRVTTSGESHGKGLIAIVEGLPSGLAVDSEAIDAELKRRQRGHGRGDRMKIEADTVEILSGIRFGETIGSPIALFIRNRDWENRKAEMAAAGPRLPGVPEVKIPRPGHADLAGAVKYGFSDIANVAERASARETAARVAAGAVCKQLLAEFGSRILSHVVSIGGVASAAGRPDDAEAASRAEESPVRCLDPEASQRMAEEIDAARERGDTLGGVFEVIAFGVPPGLGSYAQWDTRLDGLLAQAMLSIPAIKGVEVGDAFLSASRPGSQVHDEILPAESGWPARRSNRAGGIEGGVSNGEPVVVRCAMKPISSLKASLMSIDLESGEARESRYERSDVCAVPAAAAVGEAQMAIVLADALLCKFGGDSLPETKRNFESYVKENPHRR